MPKTACPTCRKPLDATHPDFPFCSDRCRLIDLGKWAAGDFVISSPILDPDVLESLQNEQARHELDGPSGKEWKN